MERLGAKIDALDAKVEQLNSKVNKVYELQKATYEAIVQLSNQMDAYHRDLVDRLTDIQRDVILNRELQKTTALSWYSNCHTLLNGGEVQKPVASYEVVRIYFNNWASPFNTCLDGLSTTITAPGAGDSLFYQSTWNDPVQDPGEVPAALKAFRGEVWNPALALLDLLSEKQKVSQDRIFASLMVPTTSTTALKLKLNGLQELKSKGNKVIPERTARHLAGVSGQAYPSENQLRLAYRTYYSAQAIDVLTQAVEVFHPYLLWRDSGRQNLQSLQQLTKLSQSSPFITPDVSLRQRMLTRQDIAIAQRNLLTGDILLPLLYDVVINPSRYTTQELSAINGYAIKLLTNNPVFASNLALYLMREELLPKADSKLQYHFALFEAAEYPDTLQSLMRHPKVLTFIKKAVNSKQTIPKWHLRLFSEAKKEASGVDVLLPDTIQIQKADLLLTPDLEEFIGFRNSLLRYEATDQILVNGTASTRRAIVTGIVLHNQREESK